MKIRLDRIEVSDFKRIETLQIDLKPITALVGGNTSGKSSALQAAQLGISILQAAFRGTRSNGLPDFLVTVANDAVLFRPTEHLLNLKRGEPATQNSGFSVTYIGEDVDTHTAKSVSIEIKRGKNANILITRNGDDDFAAILANRDRPFSVLTPGISGIPIREEWRTKGAMDAAVMHGDANLYLRSVLDHLFSGVPDEASRIAWRNNRDIGTLPKGGWRLFCELLDRCYEDMRIVVDHDPRRDRFVKVEVLRKDTRVTLDMASTGMLQVIQILAYACFYSPPLLLLDEPDAHLHADSQARLYEALKGISSETDTRILFASHSPQLIQRLLGDSEAALLWMNDGAEVPVDETRRPAIPLLMTLGALSAGAEAFDPARKMVLLTEDKDSTPVKVLALANGAPADIAVLSYNGCDNLPAARLLAAIISELRSDARVIIHRDRDFRTEPEMAYEISTATKERENLRVERVIELFTPANDVEHSFANPEHLKAAFAGRIDENIVEATVRDAISHKRDTLVIAVQKARDKLAQSLYGSERKKKKPEWAAAGLSQDPPKVTDFLPADGSVSFPLPSCHGKKLLPVLKNKFHHHVGGSTQAVQSMIFSGSAHLVSTEWQAAFAAPVIEKLE
jgi:hypothetical protein